jgi:hypothetical protein
MLLRKMGWNGVNNSCDPLKTINLISKFSVKQAEPFARLIARLENFSSVLYALRRRSEFIDSLSFAEALCPDVQFWQYLKSCQAALTGAISVLDDLHYVRQVRKQKWSLQLVKDRSPDHFPYIVLSPELQSRVKAFRAALVESCEKRKI